MRTLILVRHAKAEEGRAGLTDHDRALALRGRDDAGRLGERLASAGLVPDVVLVSSANRTRQTWKRMAGALPEAAEHIDPDLYGASVETIIETVAAVDPSAATVAVIAHEPTVSATAAQLAGPASDRATLQRVALGVSTGTAAVLEFDGEWADLAVRGARLTRLLDGRDH